MRIGTSEAIGVLAIAFMAISLSPSRTAADVTARAGKLSMVERLGKSIFEDTELSAARNQACSFCHSKDTGFTSPRDDLNAGGSVVEGSIEGRFGNSKPPSAAYAAQAPVLHHKYEDGDLLFVGGSFWNGRASGSRLGNPVADQAQMPFLNPLEMALPDAACVVQRVCKPRFPESYPVTLQAVWGADVCRIDFPETLDAACADPEAQITLPEEVEELVETAYDRIALSIAAYEASHEVNPFTSKFDHYLAGRAELTKEELRGLDLFKDKGRCADCHVLTPGPRGEAALFTDFTYDNLGVPRNPANPFFKSPFNASGDKWVEAGLKAYLATDPIYGAQADTQYGKVKVPTVRNVDKRPSPDFVKAFMHNGYFKTLKGVVNFYNTRDTKPRCPDALTSEAEAMRQGCWPEPEIAQNLNVDEMGDLKLTDAEEDAIVAFMRTLTDGYQPQAGQPGQ